MYLSRALTCLNSSSASFCCCRKLWTISKLFEASLTPIILGSILSSASSLLSVGISDIIQQALHCQELHKPRLLPGYSKILQLTVSGRLRDVSIRESSPSVGVLVVSELVGVVVVGRIFV